MKQIRTWWSAGASRFRRAAARRPVCLLLLLFLPVCGWRYQRIRYLPGEEGNSLTLTGRIEGVREGGRRRLELNKVTLFLEGNETGQERSALPDVSFFYEAEMPQKAYAYRVVADTDALEKSSETAETQIPGIGDWVLVSGTLSDFEHPTNPGQFDSALYWHNRGVGFLLKDAKILGSAGERGYRSFLDRIRRSLAASYDAVLPPAAGKVLRAVTLGDRDELPEEVRELFADGGIGHILAVSGLHISMVGMSLYRLLRRRRASIPISCAISGGVLFCYCVMTGLSLSARRALILFLLWLLAQLTGRKTDLPTSLAWAALLLLWQAPGLIYDGGACLSFGCVLSLFLLAEPIQLRIKAILGPPLSTSLAVSLGTLPICCWFYYQITPYAFLINLVVLPCMSALFLFGLAGSVLGMIFPAAGRFAAAPCHYLVQLFLLLCRGERLLPCGVWITGRPHLWQLGAYYLLLMCAFYRRSGSDGKSGRASRQMQFFLRIRKFRCGAGVLAALLILLLHPRPKDQAIFLDIGQGDCTLLQLDGASYLVDCGSSSVSEVWDRRVSDCLKYYGIRHLDGVFLTHGDSDHINGIEALLEGYQRNLLGDNASDVSVDRFFLPGAVLEAGTDAALERIRQRAEQENIPVLFLMPGDRLRGIACLYPSAEEVRAADGAPNQCSLVLEVTTKSYELLLTGDLEKEGETRFVQARLEDAAALEKTLKEAPEEAKLQKAPQQETEQETARAARQETTQGTVQETAERRLRILKVGHHGSRYATGQELLEWFRPDLALISCGRNNRYGHPAQTTLLRLSQAGAAVMRTDLAGAAIIYDGSLKDKY